MNINPEEFRKTILAGAKKKVSAGLTADEMSQLTFTIKDGRPEIQGPQELVSRALEILKGN